MIQKLTLSILAVVFMFVGVTQIQAQKDDKGLKMPDNYLSDETAKNEDQTRAWEKGDEKYPSKPKDMWELGIHGGHFMIAGDVNPQPGWAVGAHLRKSLGYVFALRFNAMYGNAKGLNYLGGEGQFVRKNTVLGTNGLGYGAGAPWYQNFKVEYAEVSTQGIITLNNLRFHRERTKWDLFLIVGLGLNWNRTSHDALNANNELYNFSSVDAGLNAGDRSDRKQIRDNIKSLLDGSYETYGEQWGSLFDIQEVFGVDNDERKAGRVNAIANAGIGFGYHLSKRVTLTLEHQATFNDDDLLDGYRWSAQGDFTRDVDVPQYTHLRLNFHLGSKKKRVEPLWWLNPLDAPYRQIADNTKKPPLSEAMKDADKDGVPDLLDQEPDTPEGCPVDTRGVTLDSDGDGVSDCEDKERYSPPGCPVDAEGVAQCPDPGYLTEPQIVELIKENAPAPVVQAAPAQAMSDWFLPMIHFDLDKYRIKPEFYNELHYVATVMKKYPSLRVVAKGHTDVRKPNAYNQVLSYNRANEAINYLVTRYGISRDRLVLQYGGEETPLVQGLPDTHGLSREKEQLQYMNRRVEFFVAEGGEMSMGRPEGPEAGSNTPRSSRGGSKYSGNPGAGY